MVSGGFTIQVVVLCGFQVVLPRGCRVLWWFVIGAVVFSDVCDTGAWWFQVDNDITSTGRLYLLVS